MNKVIFCLVVLFYSSVIYSCTFPYSGPNYDSLIEITKLSESGLFQIELPKQVNSSTKPEVIIYKYKKSNYENLNYLISLFESRKNIPNDEYDTIVDASQPEEIIDLESMETINDKVFNKINIDLNNDYIHIVNVHWPPEQCCLCSTYGSSEPLENIKINTEK